MIRMALDNRNKTIFDMSNTEQYHGNKVHRNKLHVRTDWQNIYELFRKMTE